MSWTVLIAQVPEEAKKQITYPSEEVDVVTVDKLPFDDSSDDEYRDEEGRAELTFLPTIPIPDAEMGTAFAAYSTLLRTRNVTCR